MTSKALYLLFRFAAMVAPAAILISGCSKSTDTSTVVEQAKADTSQAVVDVRVAVSNSWDSIKDDTYDRRADFSSGMNRMADTLDDHARTLRSKMAGAPDAASKDRDAAVKEYDDARADLKVKMTDLGDATADTWSDAKARTATAWTRVRTAYDKAWPNSSS
jgi:hypothetical protein